MSVSWKSECHVLYEYIKKQRLIINEQQEEISRLTIAYQNASDQRQHYVDKCLKLSEVVLEFIEVVRDFRRGYDSYNSAYEARELLLKHKDLIDELKRNLEVKSE